MATQHIQGIQAASATTGANNQRNLTRMMDRLGDFLVSYWSHILTIILGLIVFSALAVPFLSYFGLDVIAKPIFFALHAVCAQIPAHSFYILGHQVGLCARNLAVYSSMFIGCLIFVLSKKRLPGIPWWLWLLLIAPMGWDGLTQMVGWRESDWILRLITGALFGFGNVFFALPLMHKSIMDTIPAPMPQRIHVMKQTTEQVALASGTESK